MTKATATRGQLGEKADELEEIEGELRDLVYRAKELLRGTGMIGERARAYWLGHTEGFLEDLGRPCTSVGDTVAELRKAAAGEADD